MKTYKDIAHIPQVREPMDADKFWPIAEMSQSLSLPENRDIAMVQTLSFLPIREIIGFALRMAEYTASYAGGVWTAEKRQEVASAFNATFEEVALWTVFQGREFYMEVHDSPEELMKKAELFSTEDIPRPEIIDSALVTVVGRDYINYIDFIDPSVRVFLSKGYQE